MGYRDRGEQQGVERVHETLFPDRQATSAA